MAVALAAFPPDPEPPDEFGDLEPGPGEDFRFDPFDDRKWEAFLLDDDELEPLLDDFRPL